MTDQPWNQQPPGSPAGDPAQEGVHTRPLPPSVAQAQQSGGYSDAVYTPPMPVQESGPNRLVFVAALLGALVLVGGAGWFALQAFNSDDGAGSPEEVMDQMIEALNQEDLVAMAELMEPGERRAIAEPVLFEIIPELQRLGLFGDDFDPASIAGFDLELSDVTYRVERPDGSPDVAHVFFTGGTSSATANSAEMAMSDDLRELLDPGELSGEGDLASDMPIVMVERGGRWYMSLVYTVVEAGFPGEMPSLAAALQPNGSDSPEQAVETMLTDLVSLDLRDAIRGMEPGEMSALQRWAPLFIDDAQAMIDEAIAELAADNVTWRLSDLQLERSSDGDDTIVTVRGFVFRIESPQLNVDVEYGPELIEIRVDALDSEFRVSGSVTITPTAISLSGSLDGQSADVAVAFADDVWTISGEVDGEPVSGSLTLDDTCSPFRFEGFDLDESGCLSDTFPQQSIDELLAGPAGGDEFPGFEMVVVETDGDWYVSPIGTLMRAVVAQLKATDDDAIGDFVDGVLLGGDLFDDALESTVGGGLGSIGGVLDDDSGVDDGFGSDSGFDVAPGGIVVDDSLPRRSFDLAYDPTQTVVRNDTLADDELHVYLARLRAGDAIGITVQSAEPGLIDALVAVEGIDGSQVASNDDLPGTFDAGVQFLVPEDGTYSIVVGEVFRRGGDYVLTVETAAELGGLTIGGDDFMTGDSFGDDASDGGGVLTVFPMTDVVEDTFTIEVGPSTVEIAGAIAEGTHDVYAFTSSGGTLLVEFEQTEDSALDPRVIVETADGDVLGENDDDPTGAVRSFGSRLEVEVPAGAITIRAGSFADASGGDYVIRITLV